MIKDMMRNLFNPYWLSKTANKRVVKYILDYRVHGHVLEVGPGRESMKGAIRSRGWTTVDPDPSCHPDICGRVEDMECSDGTMFDRVICLQVLEHTEDPRNVLSHISRLLEYGGQAYISVPMLSRVHGEPDDYYRWTSYGLFKDMTRAGIHPVSLYHDTGWLLSFWIMLWMLAYEWVRKHFVARVAFKLLVAPFVNIIGAPMLLLPASERFSLNVVAVGWKL